MWNDAFSNIQRHCVISYASVAINAISVFFLQKGKSKDVLVTPFIMSRLTYTSAMDMVEIVLFGWLMRRPNIELRIPFYIFLVFRYTGAVIGFIGISKVLLLCNLTILIIKIASAHYFFGNFKGPSGRARVSRDGASYNDYVQKGLVEISVGYESIWLVHLATDTIMMFIFTDSSILRYIGSGITLATLRLIVTCENTRVVHAIYPAYLVVLFVNIFINMRNIYHDVVVKEM